MGALLMALEPELEVPVAVDTATVVDVVGPAVLLTTVVLGPGLALDGAGVCVVSVGLDGVSSRAVAQ